MSTSQGGTCTARCASPRDVGVLSVVIDAPPMNLIGPGLYLRRLQFLQLQPELAQLSFACQQVGRLCLLEGFHVGGLTGKRRGDLASRGA